MYFALVITNAATAPTSTLGSPMSSTTLPSKLLKLSNAVSTAQNNFLQPSLFHNNSPALNSHLRKRHSKRHSIGYDPSDLNENSTSLEWVNPCGGYYDPTAVTNQRIKRKPPIKVRKIYNALKVAAGHEFKILNDSQQAIDIENFEMWAMHKPTYKFLPKLKENSKIALKRWYRNMQTYVASFAYLRRIQLKWDYSKAQSESDIADELNTLLISSRSILCELETSVNKTHPHPRERRQLPLVSREQMNKRLKLHTREDAIRNPGVVQEANSIDLKFVKYYYYEFLENMRKVLRKFTKGSGQVGFKEQNTKTKHKNNRRKQKQSGYMQKP